MRVGLSSFAYRWAIGYRGFRPSQPMMAFDLLDRASSLGVDVVQIDDNLGWEAMEAGTLQEIVREARQRRLVVQLGTVGMTFEHMQRAIETARRMDVRLLRMHEDRRRWQPTTQEIAAQVVSLLPLLRASNVTLAIENHFWYGASDVLEIVRSADDAHVAVSLDTGNTIVRLEGWREALHLLSPHVASLHLKDLATERRGVGFYVAGRPLGKGTIDMRAVLDGVRAAGRDPDIIVELWMDFVENEGKTLRQEDEWVRESVAYARRLA